MAKGAATEVALGGLHSTLARVFIRVLEKYEKSLAVLDTLPAEDIEADMIDALMSISEPNPAMLSAVSKFLKDNDIGMDSHEVDQLNETERRLAEARKKRAASGMNLAVVPHVEAG